MALDYILVEIVILINYTPTLNKPGKDFKRTDKKLYLKTLATLLFKTHNIILRADLNKVVEKIIIVI
jgi:hypothetical protein